MTQNVEAGQFRNDMGSNPLGHDQRLRTVGEYVVEYYPDSIGDRPRMQAWRVAKDEENHWRKWKCISDFEDYDGELKDLFRSITVDELRERDETPSD